jgi:D-alanyl-D-alanine carboxypeptidase
MDGMHHSVLAATVPAAHRSRRRRLALVTLGVALAAVLAALAILGVRAATAAASGPFIPNPAAGHIAEGTVVTLADGDLPAIARLDPALREAMRQAEMDAAADGVAFEVTSGWRSARYQQWLLDDAIDRYGSEELARQYVATPDGSQHVTGEAIDIVPVNAQVWLSQHGWRYGICQTYANERWHFELATMAGGTCPEMKADASS